MRNLPRVGEETRLNEGEQSMASPTRLPSQYFSMGEIHLKKIDSGDQKDTREKAHRN